MKKITTEFLNHKESGCTLIGLSMGLFTGVLTAITYRNIFFVLIGLCAGVLFAGITHSAKSKSLLPKKEIGRIV